MKKIILIGLSAVAFSAFADSGYQPQQPSNPPAQPSSPGHHHNHHGSHHHGGHDPSIQATLLMNTAVTNSATGFFGRAEQNLASRVGVLDGRSPEVQLVMARDSIITNEAMGGTATQNIASNAGSGGLEAAKYQMAIFNDSSVINRAGFGARAVQNISSNTNCLTCDSGPSYHD